MVDISIDFGGTNIKIGLVHFGCVKAKTIIPAFADKGLIPRLSDVEKAIHQLLIDSGLMPCDCTGIGIALPGIIDPAAKTVLSINGKYADAVGFSFQEWANRIFSLDAVVENDARSALLGEIGYGAARGESNAVLIIFGTGIGTAAMINGQIVRGRHGQAGILGGHLVANVHGNRCTCGNVGCMEAQSSHWALPQLVKRHPQFLDSSLSNEIGIDYRSVIEALKAVDQVALEILEELLLYWSAGIINLIHAYDPEVVILSGGLMKSADVLLPQIVDRVHALAWTPWGKVRFVVAEDPDTSVLLGLSYLVQLSKT
ncbi:MAG: glkA2 [Bacilli bacterium]|nr:glkA2 [Bacilli bacterium]